MSSRSGRPRMWFSARAVSTRWTRPACAASAAAAIRATACRGRRSDRPVASVVLDRAAGEAGLDRQAHRLGDAVGIVGVAVLEIGRERQVGGGGELGRVRQCLVAGDGAVEAPERRREAAARRGQRLKAERAQQPGRAESHGLGSSSGGSPCAAGETSARDRPERTSPDDRASGQRPPQSTDQPRRRATKVARNRGPCRSMSHWKKVRTTSDTISALRRAGRARRRSRRCRQGLDRRRLRRRAVREVARGALLRPGRGT